MANEVFTFTTPIGDVLNTQAIADSLKEMEKLVDNKLDDDNQISGNKEFESYLKTKKRDFRDRGLTKWNSDDFIPWKPQKKKSRRKTSKNKYTLR